MTSIIWIVAAVLATFSVGYVGYSRYLSRFVDLDDDRETPAHKYEDGQEYVPAKKPVLLGHHFSSIAGGAPIVGPITAGAIWGWVPALLWVAIGNPLMGAVHDFISLSSSIRHEGRSIGYIVGQYVGERGKNLLLWFAFLTIILVVAVFALVVGIVFNAYPQVTTASFVYVLLALGFGVYLYQLNGPFIPGTVLFVAGVFAGVWLGIQYPFAIFELAGDASHPAGTFVLFESTGSGFPGAGALGGNTAAWVPVIMVYGAIASALPVWVLLQPRDYLSSFLLYTGVGGGRPRYRRRYAARNRLPAARYRLVDRGVQRLLGRRVGRPLPVVPAAFHHHRLRDDKRLPLARLLGDDRETAEQRERRPAHRLRRDAR